MYMGYDNEMQQYGNDNFIKVYNRSNLLPNLCATISIVIIMYVIALDVIELYHISVLNTCIAVLLMIYIVFYGTYCNDID